MSLLYVHAFACLFMTGVIWMVQLIQYPTLTRIPAEIFHDIHERHLTRISWIVIPPMLLEVGTAVWFSSTGNAPSSWTWMLSLVALTIIWASTFLIQAPIHGQLRKGADKAKLLRLVRTNWIRTFAWTLRAALLLLMLLGGSP